MRRILLAGVPGAGKTTMAARIAHALDLPHVEVDALYHGAGWSVRPSFRDDVRAVTAGERWVCDGQYHHLIGDIVGPRADTIVWLDLPRAVVTARVLRRSIVRVALRRSLWHGNVETWRALLFGPRHPVRLAWSAYHERRRQTRDFLAVNPHLRVIHLRSTAQVSSFAERLGRG